MAQPGTTMGWVRERNIMVLSWVICDAVDVTPGWYITPGVWVKNV